MKQFLTALIGCIVLFVVVCPITPTPVAVLDGNAHQTIHAPLVSIDAVAIVTLPRLEQAAWTVLPEIAPVTIAADVLDLNCTRLC